MSRWMRNSEPAKFGLTWCTDPLHNLDVMKHWADQYRGKFGVRPHNALPEGRLPEFLISGVHLSVISATCEGGDPAAD